MEPLSPSAGPEREERSLPMTRPLDDVEERANPGDLAWSDAPAGPSLGAWAEEGNWRAVAGFANALGKRREEMWARGQDLAMREHEMVPRPPEATADEAVTVAAVASVIRSVIVETGDDVATVATGVGVEPEWARGVLTGQVTDVDPLQVQRMCQALEATPGELFGVPASGASVMPTSPDQARASEPSAARNAPSPVVRQLLDVARFSPVEKTAADMAALDASRRAKLVGTLEDHHRRLGRWSQDLDDVRQDGPERARAPQPGVAPVSADRGDLRFPAAAAAGQIAFLVVDTGDDLDTVAAALGMEPEWAHAVVNGEIDFLSADEARQLCAGLELEPSEVFDPVAPGPPVEAVAWRRLLDEAPGMAPLDPSGHAAHALELPEPPDLDFGP